ncbi:glycosyltransferase family 2 protein [Methylacidimicrobium tartarophylax]|uniref:(Heptosyl)LPS beta-1,4-glucosyltransferase n=1 Tax=Methylacidimicrobium tartarophylax TaxID=1041768 RepID=A0A5E6MC82_9BACT|nr:glycosyltransferase family 2 protein [Methylacidimicrobium tartarophylax]VVM05900.1 (heptosyl)LPS beta-1,4-glucosyltransferase [Methylacidimicrobium tartarophylax]
MQTERTRKLPISVAMIACNEARNLPRSLGSVAGWVEEIIVVVNDCTDRTPQIAREFGARVEERAWTCRRDQKNVALGLAIQPWVLGLDADEEVSLEMRKAVEEFFSGAERKFDGASFRRKTWFLNRWITHGDWYPDYNLRLFRRERGRWGGNREHDKLILDGRVKRIRAELLHYSFPTVEDNVRKIPAFAAAFAEERQSKGLGFQWRDLLLRPLWRFLRGYVFRLGFLDGFPGLYIATVTALATFVRYAKLYEREFGKQPPLGTEASPTSLARG